MVPKTQQPALRARRLARQLAALQRVAAVLAGATRAEDVCRLALETAVETLDAEAGSILLHDAERHVLRFTHVIGASPRIEATLRNVEVAEGSGVSGRVLRSRRGLIVGDVAGYRGHNRQVDARTAFRTEMLVAAPIPSPGGPVLGVIEVLNKRRGRFDRDDLALLALLASQAGVSLETARLHQAAALASVAHRIGDVSHDVKNLMTPVETGTKTLQLLLTDLVTALQASPPPAGSPLARAAAEVAEMAPELVAMVLDGVSDVQERVSEIADAVKGAVAAPSPEPTDLRALVAAVARVLYPVAEPAGVALDVSGVESLPPLMLDRRRMHSCLYNLVHNALPETPPGGTVWVEARHLPPATEGAPDLLELVVRDNGRGMDEAVRARLFTDDTVSTKLGGTGLGTRIVRSAVEAHGGTISVQSTPGQGSRFLLRIPWRAAP